MSIQSKRRHSVASISEKAAVRRSSIIETQYHADQQQPSPSQQPNNISATSLKRQSSIQSKRHSVVSIYEKATIRRSSIVEAKYLSQTDSNEIKLSSSLGRSEASSSSNRESEEAAKSVQISLQRTFSIQSKARRSSTASIAAKLASKIKEEDEVNKAKLEARETVGKELGQRPSTVSQQSSTKRAGEPESSDFISRRQSSPAVILHNFFSPDPSNPPKAEKILTPPTSTSIERSISKSGTQSLKSTDLMSPPVKSIRSLPQPEKRRHSPNNSRPTSDLKSECLPDKFFERGSTNGGLTEMDETNSVGKQYKAATTTATPTVAPNDKFKQRKRSSSTPVEAIKSSAHVVGSPISLIS
ncbi:hypothetical protein BDR26DRAFT_9026 [Obelidium mucronatum]|nr:hypothetical protein BDR26DRAFT_9026 [Obelidium mucronatum]